MTQAPRFQIAISVLLLVCCAAPSLSATPNVADLQAKYNRLSQELTAANPAWQPKAPASGTLLFIAPDEYSPVNSAAGVVNDARTKYVAALFELAREAADAGQLSLAFQWTTETVRENPDHAGARRVLGYEQRDGKWLTAYGVKMLDAGKVWNSERGWVAANDTKANEAGAEADAARHADIKKGWQVRTDHFLVTTNHSVAAGAELAARLERLYQIWRQLFAGFYYSEKEVRGLFAGERIARVPVRQFRVVYHRDRDDYIGTLSRRQPLVVDTLGVYFDAIAEAHFFAGDNATSGGTAGATTDAAVATLYHEAVHQLFQESKPASRRVGEFANFWVLEGVATYFETLTEHNDPHAGLYFTIGESTAGRLPKAREKLHDNYYIPLADLIRLGKSDLQRRPDVAKVYSQSSGLTAYLLNGEQGRYRESLVRYLQTVYAGHDNEQTLAEATGASYSELDAAYRRYMESLP